MTDKSEHELILRARAAQAALDTWGAIPLRLGHADCVRMVASHLRNLGWRIKLPPKGSYRTLKTAQKALADAGYASLGSALDAQGLERIAAAFAIMGDIVELESEHGGIGALTIAMGNGRVAGWHPDVKKGIVVMQPHKPLTAWRATPWSGANG
jgi:hypothetical protein